MTISEKGLAFIRKHEGCEVLSYRDSVGVWTIGYGNTQYQNGQPVREGESLTVEEAKDLFKYWVDKFSISLDKLITSKVNQNQFDALVALAYNIGIGGFTTSTVRKLVNANPNNPAISAAFMMWNKGTVKGKKVVIAGLTNRRKAEADLYFS